jgi:cyanophycinase
MINGKENMPKRRVSRSAENQPGFPEPKGILIAIGGREDKGDGAVNEGQEKNKSFISEEILKRFVDELKGENPMVAVVPTASTTPEEVTKDYQRVFSSLGVSNIEVIDVRTRADAYEPAYAEMVERAAGIMFTGGDQLRLTVLLGGTTLLQLMRERYTYEPVVIAGTSAGATAMSTPMIYEGAAASGFIMGDVRITTGLEFLKDVAIDTHFIARGRIVRMAQAISMNPGCVGLGLEEDTAALFSKGREFEVLGSGIVTVVDGMGISRTNIHEVGKGEPFTICDLKMHLLSKGQKYQLPTSPQMHV